MLTLERERKKKTDVTSLASFILVCLQGNKLKTHKTANWLSWFYHIAGIHRSEAWQSLNNYSGSLKLLPSCLLHQFTGPSLSLGFSHYIRGGTGDTKRPLFTRQGCNPCSTGKKSSSCVSLAPRFPQFHHGRNRSAGENRTVLQFPFAFIPPLCLFDSVERASSLLPIKRIHSTGTAAPAWLPPLLCYFPPFPLSPVVK